ncbi:hypothetical protein GCM10010954_09170 [Halobacillus andaensis]|uniref:Uncharacterized protein n=1 Tax=Halobacillus andaensis TaxID=1176239 RepID=A0A917B213_HALAA|nr:hypothetical protein [Halobacillus andaensis]MBP2003707.1 hypothetical protein [Halobacillus andaensis]GGF12600.1 hypothetical protein GCM10010954_09170 [Halobacillus andaensis]
MIPSYWYGEKEQEKAPVSRGKTENLFGLGPAGLLLSVHPAGVGAFPFLLS